MVDRGQNDDDDDDIPSHILQNIFHCDSPRGITLHMTGYAPAFTKRVEKGSFSTYNVVDVLCKKGTFFAANPTLGVPE